MKLPIYFFTLGLLFYSCTKDDELDALDFSSNPKIELIDFSVKAIQDMSLDSIIIVIKISDREMDVGIDPGEILAPRHDKEYVIDSQNKQVTFGSSDLIPPLYRIVPVAENVYDTVLYSNTLDAIPENFDCYNYSVESVLGTGRDSMSIVKDTLLQVLNEDLFNFFMKFDSLNSDVGYFDNWHQCRPPFAFRTPYLPEVTGTIIDNYGSPYKMERLNQYEGIITVQFLTSFRLLFKNKPFRLSCYLKDNAFNISNEIVSDYIQVEE